MPEPSLFSKDVDDLLPKVAPTKPVSSATGQPTVLDLPPEQLLAIARLQKWMIWLILFSFLSVLAIVILALADDQRDREQHILPFTILMVAIQLPWVLIPCGFAVVLLRVNARATSTLRRNGIRVGLLGARRADLARFSPSSRDGALPRMGW